MEIPCTNEFIMVTFKLISMHFVPPGTLKKKNSQDFNIEVYADIKEDVFYTYPTFRDRYRPSLGSSYDSQPLGK